VLEISSLAALLFASRNGRSPSNERTVRSECARGPLQGEDLAEADRIFRVAFGTFLGLPNPIEFAGNADYVRTRWTADPSKVRRGEIRIQLWGFAGWVRGSGCRKRLRHLIAGANAGREQAYRQMVAHGFRSEFQGVAMQRRNDPGYNLSDTYIIDDWR
jgi:hypothetical protein